MNPINVGTAIESPNTVALSASAIPSAIRRVSDAAARCEVLRIEPEQARLTGIGMQEAQTKLQRSGLARAVGSEHADDLARPHLEGEIVHREDRAVTLAQPVRFQGGCHFWRTPFRVEPSSCGPEAMCTPASRSARNLSCAVPLPPEMIAPAWPIRFPGGAVAPAMNPMTGLR